MDDEDESGRDELKSEDETTAAAILVIYIARHYSKQYARLC